MRAPSVPGATARIFQHYVSPEVSHKTLDLPTDWFSQLREALQDHAEMHRFASDELKASWRWVYARYFGLLDKELGTCDDLERSTIKARVQYPIGACVEAFANALHELARDIQSPPAQSIPALVQKAKEKLIEESASQFEDYLNQGPHPAQRYRRRAHVLGYGIDEPFDDVYVNEGSRHITNSQLDSMIQAQLAKKLSLMSFAMRITELIRSQKDWPLHAEDPEAGFTMKEAQRLVSALCAQLGIDPPSLGEDAFNAFFIMSKPEGAAESKGDDGESSDDDDEGYIAIHWRHVFSLLACRLVEEGYSITSPDLRYAWRENFSGLHLSANHHLGLAASWIDEAERSRVIEPYRLTLSECLALYGFESLEKPQMMVRRAVRAALSSLPSSNLLYSAHLQGADLPLALMLWRELLLGLQEIGRRDQGYSDRVIFAIIKKGSFGSVLRRGLSHSCEITRQLAIELLEVFARCREPIWSEWLAIHRKVGKPMLSLLLEQPQCFDYLWPVFKKIDRQKMWVHILAQDDLAVLSLCRTFLLGLSRIYMDQAEAAGDAIVDMFAVRDGRADSAFQSCLTRSLSRVSALNQPGLISLFDALQACHGKVWYAWLMTENLAGENALMQLTRYPEYFKYVWRGLSKLSQQQLNQLLSAKTNAGDYIEDYMSSFLGSEWLLRLRLWVQQKSLLRSRTSIPVVLPYVMPVVTIALFCAQMKMFSVAVTAKGNERALEDVGRYTSLHLAPALFCLFQFSLDRYLDQWANARPDYLESGQRPLLASYRPLLEQHPVASFSGAVGLLCLCLSAVALPFWYYLYSTLHFETAETANYSVGAYKLLALFLSAFFVCQMAEKTADIRVPSIPCERSLNVNRP